MPILSDTLGAGFFGRTSGKRHCSLAIAWTTGSTGVAGMASRARGGLARFGSLFGLGERVAGEVAGLSQPREQRVQDHHCRAHAGGDSGPANGRQSGWLRASFLLPASTQRAVGCGSARKRS
ncbi:hypothetical protein D9M72_282030 [compost metagenome]